MAELFPQVQPVPSASQLAAQLLNVSNMTFMRMLQVAQNDYNNFWYRNRDQNGNPALTGAEPSGIDILQALGVYALPMMAMAWARVEFLVASAAAVGQADAVNINTLLPPYTLTWNPDGSLASYELKP